LVDLRQDDPQVVIPCEIGDAILQHVIGEADIYWRLI
jgi:hypothetical protein